MSLGLTTSRPGTYAILLDVGGHILDTGLVNTLKLIDNPNGSMSTAKRCHHDRSVGNFCQLG